MSPRAGLAAADPLMGAHGYSLPSGHAANPSELPFSRAKRWSITILDEGAPEPQVGHVKHAVPWSRNNFINYAAEQPIALGQKFLFQV